jgi:hypothetical protein
MKNLGRFLVVVVFVLLSVPALAQNGNRDLTLFAGAQFPGDISLGTAGTGAGLLTDPKNVGVFGLRYGRASLFGHEETFAYTPNFLDSNSKSIILSSNLIVQVPTPILRPYATAGLGPMFTWGEGPSDIGTKFFLNYGGGLKVRPAGPVGFRFDARGYSVFGIQDQTLNMVEVSAGILFAF